MRYTKVDIKGVRTFMESIQNLLQQLQRMQWSDYLDIAVVAFLIYKILPLIKTPSTTRIAKAVVVVLVIAWLTDLWHLYTVAFIMKQFLSVGLLALVILFQPELRRMLDHLGSVKLTSIFGVSKPVQQEMDAVITQTVRACEAMGREKVGALIAFAREQRLEEYFKTGTQIDGQVSDQLIRNIFFKNSSYYLYTCLFCSFKCTSFIRHILRLFARSQYRKCRYSSLFLQRFSFFSHCFKQ